MTTTSSETSPLCAEDDDPLVAVGERVPLARPRTDRSADHDAEPAGTAVEVRPFGLRFGVAVPSGGAPLPPWRYCLDRQIAVGLDGKPWRLVAGMTMATSGPSTDGGPSTGGEEWTPDQEDDD